MLLQAILGISILFSFIAWGIVTARYIWPQLRRRTRTDALRPILALHAFRFEGLAFIVSGVVSPNIPAGFAVPAAYGDLIAAALAVISYALLKTRFGIPAVWVFTIWGTADLLNAFYQANRSGLELGQLGAGYFIVTFLVPMLLITHGLTFRLLLQPDAATDGRSAETAPRRRYAT